MKEEHVFLDTSNLQKLNKIRKEKNKKEREKLKTRVDAYESNHSELKEKSEEKQFFHETHYNTEISQANFNEINLDNVNLAGSLNGSGSSKFLSDVYNYTHSSRGKVKSYNKNTRLPPFTNFVDNLIVGPGYSLENIDLKNVDLTETKFILDYQYNYSIKIDFNRLPRDLIGKTFKITATIERRRHRIIPQER